MSTLVAPTLIAKPARLRRTTVGRVLSALPVMFLLFDAGIKFTRLDVVAQSMNQLGYPAGAALGIGILELVCIALYVVPRTSVLGAVLFTGYLGGAIATHVRLANPLFTHILFPVYVAALLWGGLYLREERLRELLPVRR